MTCKSPPDDNRKATRCRGSVTIELAVLGPLLITIALLALDFGRFASRNVAVTNAARAGAAFGIMHPVAPQTKNAWDALIALVVADELSVNAWFNASDLTVPPPVVDQDDDGYWRIEVEVQYPFDTLINWPFLPGFNETRTMRRVIVMRAIR